MMGRSPIPVCPSDSYLALMCSPMLRDLLLSMGPEMKSGKKVAGFCSVLCSNSWSLCIVQYFMMS